MGKHGHISAPTEGGPGFGPLVEEIRRWGRELGFAAVRVADPARLPEAAEGLSAWLAAGFHGEMDYMARHRELRCDPEGLLAGTRSIISVRMNYLPEAAGALENLASPERAYVSRYALGRDYHKVLRGRLKALALRISGRAAHRWRVVTDSAPVMEVELANASGLGWRGKHTLLLDRDAGSYFFLGEILTDLSLPPDPPAGGHCGSCSSCISACPTGAIVAPYRLDARRCISYLTIELKGSIPEALRPSIGNRIYGCDDCQIVCPWNRFAGLGVAPEFAVRQGLDRATLVELFLWSEEEFHARLAGSAIHRIGHLRWLRNIAVALGNGPPGTAARDALQARIGHPSELVREHVRWALARLAGRFGHDAVTMKG